MSRTALWLRGLERRTLPDERVVEAARCLAALLARAQYPVPTLVILQWPRDLQGQAYLWARAFLDGAEDVPPPDHVMEAHVF